MKAPLMAGTIAVALLGGVGWSYAQLSESRSAAAAAARELSDCHRLVQRINTLRRRPAVAGVRELAATDVSRRVAQAARAAELDEANIERIDPEPPRRLGESDYREVATQVRLRGASLRQVFGFFHALGSDPSPSGALRLRDVRLSAPRGEETSDRWTVESTVTYTVFAPRSDSKSSPTQ